MSFMTVVSAIVVFASFTPSAHAEEAAKTKAAATKKTEAAKPEAKKGDKVNPHVVIETSMGQIEIELFQEQGG